MRIHRFRARVAAALAASGLFVASFVQAAPLDTNLILNPGFDDVDVGVAGPFTSVKTNLWLTDTDDAYSYPYSSNYSGPSAPADAGEYHYSGGFSAAGLGGAGQLYQLIDVNSGPSATAIASGLAKYDLSGYFSTYFLQPEFSKVSAVFLGSGNAVLGTATIGGLEFGSTLPDVGGQREWGKDQLVGLMPKGTATVRIEVAADGSATNFDGYTDSLDFRISQFEGVLGDVNLDSVVNLADFDIIRANFYEGTTYEQGDLNFDGLVTEADFRIWKDAFGGGGPNSVPEPASWVLLVGASFGAAALLRRRGR